MCWGEKEGVWGGNAAEIYNGRSVCVRHSHLCVQRVMVGDFVVRNRSFEQPGDTMAGSNNCSFDGVSVAEDVTVRDRMPNATLPSGILQHLDTPTSLQLQNYNLGQICKAMRSGRHYPWRVLLSSDSTSE